MKTCTGPRHSQETYYLQNIKGWHGKCGHLNVLKLDHEDICTHYGKHDRCVAYMSQNVLTVRVDHVWELENPSIKDMLDIARKDGWKGRWKLDSVEKAEDGSSTWYNFTK